MGGRQGLPSCSDQLPVTGLCRHCHPACHPLGNPSPASASATTAGTLLIAKNPDAAAWLAAAFRDGSSSGSSSSSPAGGRGSAQQRSRAAVSTPATGAASPGSIRKTYWAVVVKREASRRIPASGSIDLPVPSSKDSGQLQPARTRFRLLRQSERLAWLELCPATGRKHQLRLHCAQGLQAAVLGDGVYGKLRSLGQEAALTDLRQQMESSGDSDDGSSSGGGWPPLFLHCRSLSVRRPGASRGRVLSAPLPAAWQALLEQQSWPLPPS
jgi:23S rRNA-/tRNA-specific pseudouridylate synthase